MEIQTIPVASIDVTRQYRTTSEEDSILELAASIREVGLLEPPIVRKSGHLGRFELIAGSRRIEAYKRNEEHEITVRVMELGDDEVLDVQVIENLHRENPHPLDEADAFALLHEKLGELSLVAKRAAKTERYVRERLRLADLVVEGRVLLREKKMDLSSAYLLARYEPSIQKLAIAEIKKHSNEIARWDVVRVLNQISRELDKAYFSTTEPVKELGIVACSVCPKNSSNQSSLFEEETTGRCLDMNCWNEKLNHWWVGFKKDAKKIGVRVLTGKEVKEIYRPKSEGGYLAFDSEFQPIVPEQEREMREAEVFDEGKVTWAQDPLGNVQKLYPRKDLVKALRPPKERKAADPKEKLERLRRKAVNSMKEEVIRVVREKQTDLMVEALLQNFWSIGEHPKFFFPDLGEDESAGERIENLNLLERSALARELAALIVFRSDPEATIERLELEGVLEERMKPKKSGKKDLAESEKRVE